MKQIDFFSYYGSYMSFRNNDGNLVMHTKHGMAKTTHIADVMTVNLLGEGEQKLDLSFPMTSISKDDKVVNVTYSDESTVVFQGTAEAVVELDFAPVNQFDYAFRNKDETGNYYVVNSYKTFTKYIVYSDSADIFLMNNYEDKNNLVCKLVIRSREKAYTFRIQEVKHNMNRCLWDKTEFEKCVENTELVFDMFASGYRVSLPDWQDDVRYAAYILWSSVIKAEGLQKRDLVLASNHDLNCVWSFDAGFPMYGLVGIDNKLALNQIISFFEHQDEIGTIPGSMDDSNMRWMFMKPPGQGMFLRQLIKRYTLSYEEASILYNGIKKQIEFWQLYKDGNHDGICEYHHGNESCMDNATVFDFAGPIDSPDLTCYLVEAMDTLSILADTLGNWKISIYWKEQADILAQKAIKYFVNDEGLPCVRESITGKEIKTKSIIPYTLLLLKDRLPLGLRKKWIGVLERDYMSDYGLSSEAKQSEKFEEDGYFRGSVFHYYTVPLVDNLYECGEMATAERIMMSYCFAFRKSGSYECFSALSGKGQHLPSFTSSAGAFLYFCEKYLA
ncbi:MAG: hypothetical protein IJ115_01915 [Erysipelotrichaceae bacterium]|nr:hypothetical protein [Erysipelotrichaceae bacterium]